MGLMYILPVQENQLDDRVVIDKDKQITLKSYGLPMVFWGYLCAILVIIFVMAIAIKEPLAKLMQTGDPLNGLLGWAVIITMISIPTALVAFLFYEKWVVKKDQQLQIIHRLFWTPIIKRSYQLKTKDAFSLKHFLDSPNIAKMQKTPELRGFENNGYYEAHFEDIEGKTHLLDRHSRKADLKKITALLSKY